MRAVCCGVVRSPAKVAVENEQCFSSSSSSFDIHSCCCFLAIHLLKRSMRSWQKHGLEEHEQVAFLLSVLSIG